MKGLAGVEFVGLDNFKTMLKDERVLAASTQQPGLFLILCAIDHLHRTGPGGTAEQICVF